MSGSCPFCFVARGRLSPGFERLLPEISGVCEVIHSDCEYLSVLDIAPVSPGHVLILPRQHIRSLRGVWVQRPTPKIFLDVQRIKSEANFVLFEHGLPEFGFTKSGCLDHAHVHLVPALNNLAPIFHDSEVPLLELSESMYERIATGCAEYFLLDDLDGRRWAIIEDNLPSQTFRRIMLESLGQQIWDWRDFLMFSGELGTVERIHEGKHYFENFRTIFHK